MLKIWGRRSSFNVQKVLWLVGELGLAHEHIPAGGGFGRLDEPAFLALNPHGRVPVLQDGDVVVWESHTILRYLAARYSGGGFWLDDPADRSRVEGWMDWSQTSLQPDFLNGVFWGYYRTAEAQRDWPAIHRSLARCAEHFRLLDRILATRPFLVGDELSLADIPTGTSSTAISSWTSSARSCGMQPPGTSGSSCARLTASTSWCRSQICAAGWSTELVDCSPDRPFAVKPPTRIVQLWDLVSGK